MPTQYRFFFEEEHYTPILYWERDLPILEADEPSLQVIVDDFWAKLSNAKNFTQEAPTVFVDPSLTDYSAYMLNLTKGLHAIMLMPKHCNVATCLHELAHALVWPDESGDRQSHNEAWQAMYAKLLVRSGLLKGTEEETLLKMRAFCF